MNQTRTFDALGWSFAVACDDPSIVDDVEVLYEGLRTGSADEGARRFVVERADDGTSALALDGTEIIKTPDRVALLTALVHDVNRHAIDTTTLLAAHAGGVVGARGAVVMPAHMEAGKTTLTTGLVRAGFGYLSDEAVAFEWDTLDIRAYAKPLSIDPGAWFLFPELEPHLPSDGSSEEVTQWQVPPNAIRAGAAATTARARFLVFPRYCAGARSQLEGISRAEALVELAKNTFHFRTHGRRALDAFARLVPSLDCYRLDVGELDDAVAAITGLAGVPQ